MNQQEPFQYNPVTPLLESGNEAIIHFTRRDLLGESVLPIESLWTLKHSQHLLKRLSNSSYVSSVGVERHRYLIEVFKVLQMLVYKYGLNRTHPVISGACDFLFSFQSDEGDIRGFIGNQYAPYYTGIVMALLINAGYVDEPRVEEALQWLLSVRQNDGGWVIGSPGLLGIPRLSRADLAYLTADLHADTIDAFDPAQPFSHSGTGMVIRALAAHPQYRHAPETLQAAGLLKSHFFREDNYSSYRHPDHWIRFQFPFWWNNILAALDSLSLIGIPATDEKIKFALDWLISHQQEDGLWNISYSGIHKASVNNNTAETRLWVSLAVCRVFKRCYSGNPSTWRE